MNAVGLKPAEFRYEQQTGALYDLRFPKPLFMAAGYAGKGDCINQPGCQSIARRGPLPVGRYRIHAARTHPRLGPVALRLEATATTDLFGRSDFWVHGDNRKANFSASDGCPIFGRVVRDILARCAARPEGAYLNVVSGSDPGVPEPLAIGRGY